MSYQEALEAAGATVTHFDSFGSYQGDWLALVTYDGRTGWIKGSFGSCSGCDAFAAEFGYEFDPQCDEHRYEADDPTCLECLSRKALRQIKLAEFGREYLGQLLTQAEVEKEVSEHLEWDGDAKQLLDYVKRHAIGGAA